MKPSRSSEKAGENACMERAHVGRPSDHPGVLENDAKQPDDGESRLRIEQAEDGPPDLRRQPTHLNSAANVALGNVFRTTKSAHLAAMKV
eukprot:6189184-Pleurochrysis_carterae.AAC.1